jgi:ubiquinone/menaquinone biosynthesis C-methylase UbiE
LRVVRFSETASKGVAPSMIESLRKWYRRVYDFNYYNRDHWVATWATRIPNGHVVLDVGAGIGKYRSLFTHCDYRTQDFGRERDTVGKYTPLDYECDITAIPVPDGSFDVVLCTEVLEHVPEPIRAVGELARILKPGGTLLLTAPLGSFLHQEPFHFYGGYTPHWYRKFLREAGFSVRSIDPNQGFFCWFAQETWRLQELVRPRNTTRFGLGKRLGTTLVWIAMRPLAWVMPPIAYWLDGLGLDHTATVGYHVCAVRL